MAENLRRDKNNTPIDPKTTLLLFKLFISVCRQIGAKFVYSQVDPSAASPAVKKGPLAEQFVGQQIDTLISGGN